MESVTDRQGEVNLSLDQGGHDPHHKLMKKGVITPDFEKRDSVLLCYTKDEEGEIP